ncbi:MAG: hypothetical protein ACQEW0_16380 [Pseudomonadota bacterium]
MTIHESMNYWKTMHQSEGASLEDAIGVSPAEADTPELPVVLEILGDGEAHTISTIDAYLQFNGMELSGCEIAACLLRLELDGHEIKTMGPYDLFGSPERFKLIKKADLANGSGL